MAARLAAAPVLPQLMLGALVLVAVVAIIVAVVVDVVAVVVVGTAPGLAAELITT